MGERRRPLPFRYLRRRPDVVASEIDEELNVHLQMVIEDLQSRGMPPDQARREALRQFGDLDQTRRYCRQQDEEKETHMQRQLMFQDFLQDVRIGVRSLMRVPMLTITILADRGAGHRRDDGDLQRGERRAPAPAPLQDPGRLVRIYTDTPPFRFRFSIADYLALQAQQTHFEHTATYTDRTVTFTDGSVAELLRGRCDLDAYFSLLGIAPVLGRDFSEMDGRPAVLRSCSSRTDSGSSGSAGASDAIGRPIRLDGDRLRGRGRAAPALGPLELRQDFFIAQQFSPPPRRGPFFYTVDRATSSRVPTPSAAAAELARDQQAHLSDLAVVVPGRQSDVVP